MATGGRVLEGVCVELTAEAQVKVAGGGAAWFSGVRVSVQNVECGNILPRRRHLVLTNFRDIIPISVTDLIAVHLKNLCHWEGKIINPILDLQPG